MEPLDYILLLIGGFAAGIINTLAGNGSAITLPLLMLVGLPADVANVTNRIGALVQTFTAVGSLRRTLRTRFLLKESYWFIVPAVTGSIIGAVLAIEINAEVLRYIIGVVMLLLLVTMLLNPKKWLRPTDTSKSYKTLLNWGMIFLISVYGGFLQMGIGIMLLATLVLLVKYSMRDANIIKLMLALILVFPAFIVFLFSDHISWLPGSILAIGQGAGAFIGARYILFLPKANLIIRWLLILILSVSSILLLEIPRLISHIF